MAKRVQDVDERGKVSQRAYPSEVAKEEGRERKQDDDRKDQSGEPSSELECRHGKPRVARTRGQHRGVEDGEKAGEGFVGYVQRQRGTQRHPGKTEAGVTSYVHRETLPLINTDETDQNLASCLILDRALRRFRCDGSAAGSTSQYQKPSRCTRAPVATGMSWRNMGPA